MPAAVAQLPVRFRAAATESLGGLPSAFWWLWTSTLVNKLGGFVVTFMALYLTAVRGYSTGYAGLVASLYGLGSAVASLTGGVLADRIGRRPTILVAQTMTALSTAALGFSRGQLVIAAVAFLTGLSANASRPAISAVIADVVPAADRVRAFSINYWAINIGFGVSAAVAGLIAVHGYLLLFLADAATTLLCALVVFTKVPESRPTAPRPDERAAAPRVGLGTVFRDGRFIALVSMTFLFAMVMQQGSTTLAMVMGQAKLSATQYGLVIGLNGFLIVLLQIPVTRMIQGRDRAKLLMTGALLAGWGAALTAFAGRSVLFFALTVAIWTVGEIIQMPSNMSLVAELSPTHARGRYQGVSSLAWSSAACLGPALGGLLLEHVGADSVWGGCALLGTVSGIGYLLVARRVADAAAARIPEGLPARTAAEATVA
ncbi:MDR family MFS transporter [Kitasatospora viridis]|uniref:Putative MFS family arabinose efflux permease n=1 Tax=Kitasatospora viridis TaxID=281105 RepID=A0A561UIL6_9ACTN|nr:MFS transporter [Kitasatospora viridis]TWF99222.1 putative MFS family arabinose efflux permease [Kitasatospora viridis]